MRKTSWPQEAHRWGGAGTASRPRQPWCAPRKMPHARLREVGSVRGRAKNSTSGSAGGGRGGSVLQNVSSAARSSPFFKSWPKMVIMFFPRVRRLFTRLKNIPWEHKNWEILVCAESGCILERGGPKEPFLPRPAHKEETLLFV